MKCRRNPPTSASFDNRFPEVAPSDWCGHFRPKVGSARDYKAEILKYREELNTCYATAARLALRIVRTRYPDSKDWEPMDSLAGVLTQIDNAVHRPARRREAVLPYADDDSPEQEHLNDRNEG